MKRLAQAIGVALALGALPAAHGGSISWELDGGGATTCADGQGCDLNAAPGAVTVVVVDGIQITALTGLTDPLGTGDPLLDIQFGTSITGTHTLEILYSDATFDLNGLVSGDIGGTINGSATLEASLWYGDDSTLFALDNQIDGSLLFNVAGPFSGSLSGLASCDDCSVTQSLLITTGGAGGVVTGNFALTVPEPGTLALIGLGLAGFAAFRRRRQK